MQPHNNAWPPERVERLRKLTALQPPPSSGDLAKMMGTTRNAIIGKMKRLKIPLPNAGKTGLNGYEAKTKSTSENSLKAQRLMAQRMVLMRAAQRTTGSELPRQKVTLPPPVPPRRVQISELSQALILECRWILGAPDHNAEYCGLPTVTGKSWCEYHCSKAFDFRTRGERDQAGGGSFLCRAGLPKPRTV
jgi:hypothetical protein